MLIEQHKLQQFGLTHMITRIFQVEFTIKNSNMNANWQLRWQKLKYLLTANLPASE